MKKGGRSTGRRSASAKTSRRKKPSRSGGSKGGFFSKQSKGSASGGLFGDIKKMYKHGKRKSAFVKPAGDPGEKAPFDGQDYTQSTDENLIPQAVQSAAGSGCGCCSSIGGLITLVVIGVFAAIIVLIVKCGGC